MNPIFPRNPSKHQNATFTRYRERTYEISSCWIYSFTVHIKIQKNIHCTLKKSIGDVERQSPVILAFVAFEFVDKPRCIFIGWINAHLSGQLFRLTIVICHSISHKHAVPHFLRVEVIFLTRYSLFIILKYSRQRLNLNRTWQVIRVLIHRQ